VSIKHKLRMLLLYLPLLAGSLTGVPMRLEDINELMEAENQERIEHVIPDESENGDETIKEIKHWFRAVGEGREGSSLP
jgi:hypothetical protein